MQRCVMPSLSSRRPDHKVLDQMSRFTVACTIEWSVLVAIETAGTRVGDYFFSRCPQDVVDSHSGLAFLKEASDFHTRYITTVRQRHSDPTR